MRQARDPRDSINKAWVKTIQKPDNAMTAIVGSAAEEDTTPSEREAPARFAWWHPQSADLGRRAEAIGFGMSIFAAFDAAVAGSSFVSTTSRSPFVS